VERDAVEPQVVADADVRLRGEVGLRTHHVAVHAGAVHHERGVAQLEIARDRDVLDAAAEARRVPPEIVRQVDVFALIEAAAGPRLGPLAQVGQPGEVHVELVRPEVDVAAQLPEIRCEAVRVAMRRGRDVDVEHDVGGGDHAAVTDVRRPREQELAVEIALVTEPVLGLRARRLEADLPSALGADPVAGAEVAVEVDVSHLGLDALGHLLLDHLAQALFGQMLLLRLGRRGLVRLRRALLRLLLLLGRTFLGLLGASSRGRCDHCRHSQIPSQSI
jgi:hypothetical protein